MKQHSIFIGENKVRAISKYPIKSKRSKKKGNNKKLKLIELSWYLECEGEININWNGKFNFSRNNIINNQQQKKRKLCKDEK